MIPSGPLTIAAHLLIGVMATGVTLLRRRWARTSDPARAGVTSSGGNARNAQSTVHSMPAAPPASVAWTPPSDINAVLDRRPATIALSKLIDTGSPTPPEGRSMIVIQP